MAFRPGSLPPPTDTNTIGEDYVQCTLTRSTTDTWFWQAQVSEGFYICLTGSVDSTDVCLGDDANPIWADTNNYTPNTESTSDWATPAADDDYNNPWCTHYNTKNGDPLSPYECSAITCTVERALDTGDAVRDLAFDVASSGSDTMVINRGRARLFINKDVS